MTWSIHPQDHQININEHALYKISTDAGNFDHGLPELIVETLGVGIWLSKLKLATKMVHLSCMSGEDRIDSYCCPLTTTQVVYLHRS